MRGYSCRRVYPKQRVRASRSAQLQPQILDRAGMGLEVFQDFRAHSYRDPRMKPKNPANPFAALAALRDELPPGTPPAPPSEVTSTAKIPARAVLRLERKGRGGKEVTVLEQTELPEETLESWCRELKQALGCGGSVEELSIVLQGDRREKVKQWLLDRGVKKVSVG